MIGESSGRLYSQAHGTTEIVWAGTWEMAPLVKCLRHKYEDLNSIPLTPCENLGTVVYFCNPSIEKGATGDTGTP